MKSILLTLYTVPEVSARYIVKRKAFLQAETPDEMVDKIGEMKRDCSTYCNSRVLFMTMTSGHDDFPATEIDQPVTVKLIRELYER